MNFVENKMIDFTLSLYPSSIEGEGVNREWFDPSSSSGLTMNVINVGLRRFSPIYTSIHYVMPAKAGIQ